MSDAAVLRRMLSEWIRQTGWAYRITVVWWITAAVINAATDDLQAGVWIVVSTVLLTGMNLLMWMLQETMETVAQIQDEMGKPQPKRQTWDLRAGLQYNTDCPDYPGPCLCSKKHTRLDG